MPDTFSALSRVIDTAKKLREVSQKVQDAETRDLIADLTLELADLKMEAANLQEENANLQEQLQKAQNASTLSDKLEMRNGLYYLTEIVPGKEEGPYCPDCFESHQKLMQVRDLPRALR